MSLVLDCSATLAWIHPDEVTPAILSLFERIRDSGAWVPSLWKLEVANALGMTVRRGRYPLDFVSDSLADLALFPIHQDEDTSSHAWTSTFTLARRHNLTAYDAAYLELAKRRALPLATLDRLLAAAAVKEEVAVLGL
jgi:predicted nucleic acid-binding protein